MIHRLLALPVAAVLGLAGLAAAGLVPTGCAAPPPEKRLPAGTFLVGRGDGLASFLAQCRELTGTPLARTAEVLSARLADCAEFAAHCPAGEECSLIDRLACGAGGEELAPARELLGDASWLVAGSFAGGRALLRGRPVSAGGQRLDAEVWMDGSAGDEEGEEAGGGRRALSLLLPAAEGPGPPRLADGESLVHLRVRPDGGLDVASLIPADSMAARLYRLKSDLFVATALAGEWELAVYMPRPGQLIPPVALAIDATRRDLAVKAMETFLAQVGEIWPVERVPYRVGDHDGACLSTLKVLPDLAPCYVATDEALVVGWNPVSIELALAGDGGGATPAGVGADPNAGASGSPLDGGAESALAVALERLPEADHRLAAASGANGARALRYPLRALSVRGWRDGDVYRFEGELTGW